MCPHRTKPQEISWNRLASLLLKGPPGQEDEKMSRAWSSLAVASLVGVLVGCGSDVEGVETWDDGTAAQTEQLEGCEAFRP